LASTQEPMPFNEKQYRNHINKMIFN